MARVAVITLVLTPIMTYLLLPWITRRLGVVAAWEAVAGPLS